VFPSTPRRSSLLTSSPLLVWVGSQSWVSCLKLPVGPSPCCPPAHTDNVHTLAIQVKQESFPCFWGGEDVPYACYGLGRDLGGSGMRPLPFAGPPRAVAMGIEMSRDEVVVIGLLFAKYLREHPEARKEYMDGLKQMLMEESPFHAWAKQLTSRKTSHED
jgi:hypothetical protein